MTIISKTKAFKLLQLRNRKGQPRCVKTVRNGVSVIERASSRSRKSATVFAIGN